MPWSTKRKSKYHFSARTGPNGMAGQIQQHLPQAIARHTQTSRKGDSQLGGQQHTLLAEPRRQQLHHSVQQAFRFEVRCRQLNHSSIDASEVQHVVKQVGQRLGRLPRDSDQPLFFTVQ